MIAPPLPIRRAAVGTVQIANNVKLEAIAKVLPGWYVVPVPVLSVFHPANVNPCLASDDHGIATDGTYLYQIRYARGYKVWALQTTSPSFLVFNGDADGAAATTPACGATTGITATYCLISNPVNGASTGAALTNATYFGRSHGLGKYLVGDFDGSSRFWLSEAATPPPGPGNPDITPPSFTNSDTFTVTENSATSFNAATITVNDSATLVIAAGNDGALFNIIKVETATAKSVYNL